MRFVPTRLSGVLVVEPEPAQDERGEFLRTWCAGEFAAHGLVTDVAQRSLSVNVRRGTLRGMHWQAPPHGEHKLVRCTRGAVHDVVLDLRPRSETYCEWVSVRLDERTRNAVWIPPGCAHGFVTLEDDSHVQYQMDVSYAPESARGARWDDPAFGIEWPRIDGVDEYVIGERDAAWPGFELSGGRR